MNYSNISILSIIEKWSIKPVRVRGNSAMFYALNRSERTPSLFVNFAKNQFFDFGSGVGGGPIQFIMYAMGSSFDAAIEMLNEKELEYLPHNSKSYPLKEESKIQIIKSGAIQRRVLIDYLNQRRISVNLARVYCTEVDYQINDKTFFAIGLQNDKGGYELNSSIWKGGNSPKYFRSILNGNDKLIIVEGFFDFLSLLTMDFNLENEFDFIILNSVYNRKKLPFRLLYEYLEIRLYLDNDEAGRDTSTYISNRLENTIDYSHLYTTFKDVNDWLIANPNENIHQTKSSN